MDDVLRVSLEIKQGGSGVGVHGVRWGGGVRGSDVLAMLMCARSCTCMCIYARMHA